MPDIPVASQIFDIAFHPSSSTVFAALLTGDVKAFKYDENFRSSDLEGERDDGTEVERVENSKGSGSGRKDIDENRGRSGKEGKGSAFSSEESSFAQHLFTVRPSKRSCRGLALSADGGKVYSVGKGKAIYTIDVETAKVVDSRLGAHQAAINRIERLMANMLVTGDDDGVIKLWDPRKQDAIRSYDHHFDFISDFLWIEDKKQVVATSGDGTLSVIDVRSSKSTTPFAHSEDQEDELLSIVQIRGGAKTVVGTQLGILSVFNKSSGWGDCVDRIPGHPHSIDALCNIPSSYPSSHSTLLTGSSDGLLRAVQLFPTKLLGVVADHGEFPIERVKVDRGGEGMWVGSVGHDEVVKMTWLGDVFEDEDKEGETGETGECGEESDGEREAGDSKVKKGDSSDDEEDGDSDDSDVKPPPAPKSKFAPKLKSKIVAKQTSDSEDEPEHEDEPEPSNKKRDKRPTATESSNSEEEQEEQEVLPKENKRKRKEPDPLAVGRKAKKKGRNELSVDASFFSGL